MVVATLRLLRRMMTCLSEGTMTLQQELEEMKKDAKSMRDALLAMGVKASILYKLEQIMKICDGEATDDAVTEAKTLLWSLRFAADSPPN